MSHDIFWTDSKLDELKRMHAAGWSASMIGKAIGTTRNAVIGKLFRLRQTPATRRNPRVVARGEMQGRQLKVAVGFSPEQHERIAALAIAQGISFSAQVRELIEIGLTVEQDLLSSQPEAAHA